MKHILTKALIAAAGAALAVQSASATNAYNNPASSSPDLLLSFRETGFSDLVVDIGHASTYLNATATINLDTLFPPTGSYQSLSSLLDHNFGGTAAGVIWSVGGSVKPGGTANFVYATDPSDNTALVGQSSLNGASSDFASIGSAYQTATTGQTLVPNVAANVSGTVTSKGPAASGAMGFGVESLVPAGSVSTADFYAFSSTATSIAPGYFEIFANGNGEYVVTAVPEPTTYGLIAAGGLLLLSLRRQFTRQQA